MSGQRKPLTVEMEVRRYALELAAVIMPGRADLRISADLVRACNGAALAAVRTVILAAIDQHTRSRSTIKAPVLWPEGRRK